VREGDLKRVCTQADEGSVRIRAITSRLRRRVAADVVLDQALIEQSREAASEMPSAAGQRATLVVGSLFATGATAIALAYDSHRPLEPICALLLLLGYAVASRVEFETGGGSAIPTQIAFVPMVLVLPIDHVPFFVAGGLILGAMLDKIRGPGVRADRVLSALASSAYSLGPVLVVAVAGEPSLGVDSLPVYAFALTAQFGADLAAAILHEWLRFNVRPSLQLRLMGGVYLVDLALTPLGLIVAETVKDAPYAPLALLPFMGLLQRFAHERRVRIDHALELGHAYRGTALLLGDVVEADDAYTGSHSKEVVELVLAVADRMHVPPDERLRAEFAALLHDVGKLRIPGEIVNKPGTLDRAEVEVMRRHTIHGQELLERVGGLLGEVGGIVRSCHERWDGKGYPDGLLADEIPLIARIVACCDAYHAMITDRSYRRALRTEAAIAELRHNAGTQFDPRVVKALLDVSAARARSSGGNAAGGGLDGVRAEPAVTRPRRGSRRGARTSGALRNPLRRATRGSRRRRSRDLRASRAASAPRRGIPPAPPPAPLPGCAGT
jgi:HD-GYP domain-containing protein (c-di-GMP phosphodiesterase class II)